MAIYSLALAFAAEAICNCNLFAFAAVGQRHSCLAATIQTFGTDAHRAGLLFLHPISFAHRISLRARDPLFSFHAGRCWRSLARAEDQDVRSAMTCHRFLFAAA